MFFFFWFINICISLFILIIGGVLIMYSFFNVGYWLLVVLVLLVLSMFFWFRDVVFEGIYLGYYILVV